MFDLLTSKNYKSKQNRVKMTNNVNKVKWSLDIVIGKDNTKTSNTVCLV